MGQQTLGAEPLRRGWIALQVTFQHALLEAVALQRVEREHFVVGLHRLLLKIHLEPGVHEESDRMAQKALELG